MSGAECYYQQQLNVQLDKSIDKICNINHMILYKSLLTGFVFIGCGG